jgi:hypothetical protein
MKARRLAMILILSSIPVVCRICGMVGVIVSRDTRGRVAEKCERDARGKRFGRRGIERTVETMVDNSSGRDDGSVVNGMVTSGTRRGSEGDAFDSIGIEMIARVISG